MTAADVQDLAAHARELMVEALYEMSSSEKISKPPAAQVVTEKVSTDKVMEREEEPSTPLESLTSVVPSIGAIPSSAEAALSSVGSTSSLASSSVSVGQRSGRGDGTETEEDDEMVLVGRPKNN